MIQIILEVIHCVLRDCLGMDRCMHDVLIKQRTDPHIETIQLCHNYWRIQFEGWVAAPSTPHTHITSTLLLSGRVDPLGCLPVDAVACDKIRGHAHYSSHITCIARKPCAEAGKRNTRGEKSDGPILAGVLG
jgi:hypothetical protein